MLIDKKIMISGIVMFTIGMTAVIYLSSTIPAGQSGMTEEEIIDLLTKQQENKDMNTLAGILIGIGFLLIVISFGARRKKGSPKKEEKPHNTSNN